ncbi:tetratricopeptide repeat protein [Mucilaginibacter glaciei]|uniref:Tetratricopeptide repeat protein n=1 Tax=Mucilaginibacter glaciei TaxID=2772109 RepID=A0A926S347_9SPHI|nr:tetratricopeptide repeat protein [Mucilaginibacter glaciei]MBD1394838.1 hypothetical protein [Mucilaginibacter glaciei]
MLFSYGHCFVFFNGNYKIGVLVNMLMTKMGSKMPKIWVAVFLLFLTFTARAQQAPEKSNKELLDLAVYEINEDKNYPYAFDLVNFGLKQNPDDTELRVLLARLYVLTKEPAKAGAEFKKVLGKDPNNADALQYLKDIDPKYLSGADAITKVPAKKVAGKKKSVIAKQVAIPVDQVAVVEKPVNVKPVTVPVEKVAVVEKSVTVKPVTVPVEKVAVVEKPVFVKPISVPVEKVAVVEKPVTVKPVAVPVEKVTVVEKPVIVKPVTVPVEKVAVVEKPVNVKPVPIPVEKVAVVEKPVIVKPVAVPVEKVTVVEKPVIVKPVTVPVEKVAVVEKPVAVKPVAVPVEKVAVVEKPVAVKPVAVPVEKVAVVEKPVTVKPVVVPVEQPILMGETNNAGVLVQRAKMLAKNNDFESAYRIASALYHSDPSDQYLISFYADLHVQAATYYRNQGDKVKADQELATAFAINPANSAASAYMDLLEANDKAMKKP